MDMKYILKNQSVHLLNDINIFKFLSLCIAQPI